MYIIHKNFLDNVADRKYRIVRNDDLIDIMIYESFYYIAPFESKINYHGDLVAVSKEFADGTKGVTVQYKKYNEY